MFPRKPLQEQPHPAPCHTHMTRGTRLTAGTGPVASRAQPRSQPGLQPRSGRPSSRRHFSRPLRSGPGAHPRSQPRRAARQTPALTCASRPGQPLQPGRRFTPFGRRKPASGRRAAVVRPPAVTAGNRAAYMIDAASRFPPKAPPLPLLPSNPQLSRPPAPPPPPSPRDARIRCSGAGSPAQIESSWAIWPRLGRLSVPRRGRAAARVSVGRRGHQTHAGRPATTVYIR